MKGTILQKIVAKYYGPYQVIANICRVAYKLRLPEEAHTIYFESRNSKGTTIELYISAMRYLLTGNGKRKSHRE